jgi:5-methylcytosine-specific restriction endonuclease McrA
MNGIRTNHDQIVAQLTEEFSFHPLTAKIYVEYNGKCAYCGLDLLETTVKYHSGVIDRVLPIIKYPELEWEENNLALSCFTCSDLKGDYDVLESDKNNILEILREYKGVLIDKIKLELSKRMQTVENERIRVKQIVRGRYKVS